MSSKELRKFISLVENQTEKSEPLNEVSSGMRNLFGLKVSEETTKLYAALQEYLIGFDTNIRVVSNDTIYVIPNSPFRLMGFLDLCSHAVENENWELSNPTRGRIVYKKRNLVVYLRSDHRGCRNPDIFPDIPTEPYVELKLEKRAK